MRDFFNSINFRKGRVSVIIANARKLGIIIWNMVVKNIQYYNPENYLYLDEKRKLGSVKRIRKKVSKFNLKPEDLDFSTP
jgi:transposase